MICFLQHVAVEGPGTLGEFFISRGFEVRTVALYKGELLPDDGEGIQAAVILGGPMNVYEDAAYPFLAAETDWIRALVHNGTMVIGLCLGAQLIAKALGAAVYRAPVKEIGFAPVRLTEQGEQDPLFNGLPQDLNFFQWHEDTFDLPPGADLLVSGSACRNQVFRAGDRAYGFQCHMEVRRQDALDWLAAYQGTDPAEYQRLKMMVDRQFDTHEEGLYRTAQKIYNNILCVMEEGGQAVRPIEVCEQRNAG